MQTIIVFTFYLWGIETCNYIFFYYFHFKFTFYLWGIETRHQYSLLSHQVQFTFYLWGIETILHCIIKIFTIIFTFYLWGIETIYKSKLYHIYQPIYILPMRNWNKCGYEWKKNDIKIYILPMRNWNSLLLLVLSIL